jgi:hypothetical protein
MPHPTEARQLPGVNGQWIKTSECPPTIADLDEDEELVVRLANGNCKVTSLRGASSYELWGAGFCCGPSPLFNA